METFRTIDRLSVGDIKKIQEKLLSGTLSHAYETSPYYRKIFDERALSPSDIFTLNNLETLPFTTRQDIPKNNWSFLSVKRHDIAEVVSTTGTTGEPVFIALTANDIKRLSYNEEKNFGYAGVSKEDLFHIAVTCDNLFIAGIAYYRGLLELGASVVRVGPQNIHRHFDLIRELKPSGIIAVPSFMYHMIHRARENGLDVKELGVEKIILIGDSIRKMDLSSNACGSFIESSFGGKCFSTYGITEGQVAFCECEYKSGLHSHPDLVFVEIVDDKGKLLRDGETGELVITPLQIEGMPLIRYRTGDITFKLSEQCLCGRNSVRIGPILGRKHHMMKIKGVTLYPKAIENIILKVEDVQNYQIEAHTGNGQADHIIIRVGSYRNDEEFRMGLVDIFRAKIKATPEIIIESPEKIEKRLFEGGSRKAITFKDWRSNSYV